MQKQETAKFVFAFTTYSKQSPSQTEWESHGVIRYEETQWLSLKYVMIRFASRKRTQQVKDILDSFAIKTHKLGSEPSDITSFNVKDTKKNSIVYKMIQKHKTSGSYVKWAIFKELATVASSGKRKREPAQPQACTNCYNDKTEDEEEEELDPEKKRQVLNAEEPVQQPVVQAIYIDAPVVNLEAEVERLRSILAERDRLVDAQAKHLADKDKVIAEKSRQIDSLVSAFRGT